MTNPFSLRKCLGVALLFLATAVYAADSAPATPTFLAGVDFSHVALFESHGVVYRDGGQARDPFQILKDHSINCVRLRLFTSSAAQARQNPFDAINNLEYTLPVAQRVKKAGLLFLLDFHYSDTWADPGKQAKPETWKNLSFDQLETRMYEYNRDTIAAFAKAGALPDYVQIGNEITPGMLWPDGRVGGKFDTAEQWSYLARLLKAAHRGIMEAAGTHRPQIMIHLDTGGSWGATHWFFDHLVEQQVPFDMIGLSYYPFWHPNIEDLRTCMTNAAARYGKPVVVAETAFPWNTKEWDGKPAKPVAGFPSSKEGQVQFMQALGALVKAVPNHRGHGIFWWAAEFVSTPTLRHDDFATKSFFDKDGNALPVIDALGRLR